jgi:rhodanese-related sulfurtransferase
MTKQIGVETLRQWLDERQPVTVLDIRSEDDRAQWAIPGSLHVNAYDALRAGDAGPLATITLPDQPVVTICNTERVSQTAADLLVQRGLDAGSLVGGMKAWSLAWNAADVPRSDDPSARVVQVRRTGKGCLSYVVASAGEAAVIDPSVSSDVYVDLARRHGWSIRYVIETHVHADQLSRARESGELSAVDPTDLEAGANRCAIR